MRPHDSETDSSQIEGVQVLTLVKLETNNIHVWTFLHKKPYHNYIAEILSNGTITTRSYPALSFLLLFSLLSGPCLFLWHLALISYLDEKKSLEFVLRLHEQAFNLRDCVTTVAHMWLITFPPGEGTLGISGWGYAAGTLEPLAYTRATILVKNLETLVSVSPSPMLIWVSRWSECFKTRVAQHWGGRRHISGGKTV